jgi:C4-type Zn-finger protein
VAADVTTEIQNGLATAAALTTVEGKIDAIDDFLDTEIAAILAAVDTEVAAIKAKTDSLTFTVAGQVDANVQSINDAALTGDGGATPWGPA